MPIALDLFDHWREHSTTDSTLWYKIKTSKVRKENREKQHQSRHNQAMFRFPPPLLSTMKLLPVPLTLLRLPLKKFNELLHPPHLPALLFLTEKLGAQRPTQ